MIEVPRHVEEIRRQLELLRSAVDALRQQRDLVEARVEHLDTRITRMSTAIDDRLSTVTSRIEELAEGLTLVLTKWNAADALAGQLRELAESVSFLMRREREQYKREPEEKKASGPPAALVSQREFARRLGIGRNILPRLIREGTLRTVDGPAKRALIPATEIERLATVGLQRRRRGRPRGPQ